ncbi:MAG: DHH family phosphoesterase, partial [Clostridiales bacterium]|nr:DHH family phosphoesterase [Clostridiales bacterium]
MKKNKITSIYLIFGLLYTMFLLLAISDYLLFSKRADHLWIIGAVVVLAFLVLTIITTIRFRQDLRERIQANAVQVSLTQRQYLEQWSQPYAVIDHDGKVIWYNKAFGTIFENSASLETATFASLIGQTVEMPASEVYPAQTRIDLKDHQYDLLVQMIHREEDQDLGVQMYAVSMMDVTEQLALQRENEEIKTVVCLIYVDNYDTIAGGLEEGRRPMLEAMIYRRLNDMTESLNGILTRLEKDRFFVIFPRRSLGMLEESRFQILTDIRQVKVGNTLPLTLSIGVGDADRLDRAQNFARSAVDLAMGRGGDQAVVKNEEKYTFFGGSSIGVEKNSRARARLITYAIRELMAGCEEIMIMGHKNPDLDCFGAALGMYRFAAETKKPAHIVLGDQYGAIKTLLDRTRMERDYEGLIITHEEALERISDSTLLIVVDVNRPSITECPELLEKAKNVAVIDHHRVSAEHVEHASVSYIEPFASSACEMVSELLQYTEERISLKPIEADAMLSGIQLDTKNYTNKTGVRTFEAAAFLRRNGADAVRIRKLFKNDMNEYKIKAHIVSQASMYYGRIAIA